MDATAHISPVTLFYYLIEAMTLNTDEQQHFENCDYCQSMAEEFKRYASPSAVRAA